MKCPYCSGDTEVVDSRWIKELNRKQRRRKCKVCGERFKTVESVQLKTPKVVKRDGRRELFNRDKLRHALELATTKREVSDEMISDLIADVEHRVGRLNQPEVKTSIIGQFVMESLYRLDRVAYVRFASIYREFQDTGAFHELLAEMDGEPAHEQQLSFKFDQEN